MLPKPLLKVRKKPILEHILIKLEEAKYTEIYISTHYLHSKIKDYIKHTKLYYNQSKPIISDSKFDDLKLSILELEKKHNFLVK